MVSPQLQAIITPLKWRVWEAGLSTHPNPKFGNYISQGIREEFRKGFDGQVACRATSANLPSTTEHPQPVEEFLSRECEARRVSGRQYIDNFLVAEPPDSPICQDSVTETHVLCEELGLPLAIDKEEGPSNVISFFGMI